MNEKGGVDMQHVGVLHGLSHHFEHSSPVAYALRYKDAEVALNERIGAHIRLEHTGAMECIACGRKIKKTYNSGYCYPCFVNLAENDLCIVRPSDCHYHLGTCRDASFGDRYCMIPHYVYLAQSSDIKVGLTRKHNELKRWIDQGAVQAIPIAELPTRKLAGELELALSKALPDKTNWRKMLKGDLDEIDLLEKREEAFALFPPEFRDYQITHASPTYITYPIEGEVTKLTSFNLEKNPVVEGKLIGIKGQYLLLEQGVVNMRKHAGYHIQMES